MEEADGDSIESAQVETMTEQRAVGEVRSPGVIVGSPAAPSNPSLPTKADAGGERDERPSLSYKDLIIEAIESSPDKRLKLSEIYQVIRYLHPFYQKRVDQWGWQNSIRHNLSLHDCFVKLPMKQTSANGVVGHFWTVARDREDKQQKGSTRRRNRQSGTAGSGRRYNGKPGREVKTRALKGKERQSVSSSDSGVMSDESQCTDSPTSTSAEVGSNLRPTAIHHHPSTSASGESYDLSVLHALSRAPYESAPVLTGNGAASFTDLSAFFQKLQVPALATPSLLDGLVPLLSGSSLQPLQSPLTSIPSLTLQHSTTGSGSPTNPTLASLFSGTASVPSFTFPPSSSAGNIIPQLPHDSIGGSELRGFQLLNIYMQQQQQNLLQSQVKPEPALVTPAERLSIPASNSTSSLLNSLLAQVLLNKLAASGGQPTTNAGFEELATNSLSPSTLTNSCKNNNEYLYQPTPTSETSLVKPIPRMPNTNGPVIQPSESTQQLLAIQKLIYASKLGGIEAEPILNGTRFDQALQGGMRSESAAVMKSESAVAV